jgi:hypothetical protein
MLLSNVGESPTDIRRHIPRQFCSHREISNIAQDRIQYRGSREHGNEPSGPSKDKEFSETVRLLASREKERLPCGVFIQVENENSAYLVAF